MFSLSTLVGQLPPPSLAETDFPRFAVRALGKRPLSEMRRVLAALREDSLTGYPPAVAPALAVFVERLLAEGVEPPSLDLPRAAALLGSAEGIEALGRAITLERSVLRPGLTVSLDVREFLGERLATLPGFGGTLALLSPVVVLRGHGIGYASVRTPAVARPMRAEESEAIRDAWGLIEEHTGWPEELGHLWESRFFRVVARPNHDLDGCRELLEPMAGPARRALWATLLEHLRDQELPVEHRPGERGLQRRLADADLTVPAESLGALMDLAGWLFARLGPSLAVARGEAALSSDDVAAWTGWVQVPEASRERLGALPAEAIERGLRALTAKEGQRADPPLDPVLARDLAAFREEYLRWRYGRDIAPLRGADPLDLVRAQREAGHDVRSIVRDAAALAQDARRYCEAQRASERQREAEAEAAERAAAASPAEQPDAASEATEGEGDTPAAGDSEVIGPGERRAPKEPTPFDGLAPKPRRLPPEPPGLNPFASGSEPPARSAPRGPRMPSQDALPPLPEPPARKRPTTRRFELPPLPQPPPRTTQNRPRTTERPPLAAAPGSPGVTTPSTPPAEPARPRAVAPPGPLPSMAAPAPPRARPRATEPGTSSARPATQDGLGRALSRPPTVPTLGPAAAAALRAPRDKRLTTPGQAIAFYEEAFRELEVFERDLLQRGSSPEAERRVRELGKDADALAAALGPPARSGDPAFQSALKKVELVRAYLERIVPLLEGRLPPEEPPPPPPPQGMLGRLGRLLGRGED
ncbi:MAG: hypothetical protein H6746_11480 [Deltaproteobacteria bacterium]|nr:hypothetical protein [Deltaproteobacteria bacterium]